MQRTLLLVSLIALAAAPAAAQGKSHEHRRDSYSSRDAYSSRDRYNSRDSYSSKTQRTYIDSRGLECREKNEIKKDGRRKYDLKCKEPKRNRSDRTYSHDRLPTSRGRSPVSMSDILGEIANRRQPR